MPFLGNPVAQTGVLAPPTVPGHCVLDTEYASCLSSTFLQMVFWFTHVPSPRNVTRITGYCYQCDSYKL